MSNSNRQDSVNWSGILPCVLLLSGGAVAVMYTFVMEMIYRSQCNNSAGMLGLAIVFIGSGVYQKTLYDKQCLSQRISELEKQIEILNQELATLKEKQ